MRRFLFWLKWGWRATLALTLFAFLHYVLPQHDVVRITSTETRRMDFGENALFWGPGDSGAATGQTTRDVKFIETIQANGKPMVYRNEDTGWIWPPYFKFDSFNLQTEAADLRSTPEAPKWVMITHYGWRNQWLTIFPNAISLRPVAGPDVTVFPWVNLVILAFLAFVVFMLRRMWLQFRERMIDPALAVLTRRRPEAPPGSDGGDGAA